MILLNELPEKNRSIPEMDRLMLGREAPGQVLSYLHLCPDYAPTPLFRLPALARTLGIGGLRIKDEGARLGLGSFKALGGAYAVIRIIAEMAERALGRPIDPAMLTAPEVRAIAAGVTVGCATDGNHGRSVAAGARLMGARAVIFLHRGVSAEREAAIAALGATTVRVEGNYDDSVAHALRVCSERGWPVVSDTSWPGYEATPLRVMQGYTAMLREVLDAAPTPPSHVFIQAGVGGVAAAIAAHLSEVCGDAMPRIVVVEPERAACLLESARRGKAGPIPHGEPTLMAMLECYEPSPVAWRILARTAHAFMTVGEEDAADAMRRLARPIDGDPAIVAGESGGVGLAALLSVADDAEARRLLDLGPDAEVLLFNTEGATDPGIYRSITGIEPDALLAAARS
ncbi:diaminopropionate ammonia-lyase [Rhizorhabdus wittichii]|uniref:diaminopropionate ammonia-lyase n=1 Tax=Rhizorhabdus wittichii TaxID=160791 RepID=UPI0002E5FD1D|nr:diaminopropionate ammonia-lyase [Rhizorhabdus wittichii]